MNRYEELSTKNLFDKYKIYSNASKLANYPIYLNNIINKISSVLGERGFYVYFNGIDLILRYKDTLREVLFDDKGIIIPSNPALIGSIAWLNAKDYNPAADVMKLQNRINKENVSKQKENMKNIFIKFENPTLVNYVAGQLRHKLSLTNAMVEPITDGKFTGIVINGSSIAIMKYDFVFKPKQSKEFTITSGANADIIIAEVVKEYNEPEFGTFVFGGHYTGSSINIEIYRNKVRFLGRTVSLKSAMNFFNNSISTSEGGLMIGGENMILFTDNGGYKYYATRAEINDLINRLNQASFDSL